MTNLAANLSWLFTEVPLIDRFAAAAASGFRAVEILYPYELAPGTIAAALDEHKLELVLLNLPSGDPANGDRGFAARPGDEVRFDQCLQMALHYASVCRCARVHAMSGRRIEGISLAAHEETLIANLANASASCSDAGVTLLIEPLNERDNPGYVLTSSDQAIRVLDRVARPSVSLQLDLYHTSITEGHVAERIRALRGRFAHVQLAGVPDRHEPDVGELNAHQMLSLLDTEGYLGWVGLEYAPRSTTAAGLAWADRYLQPPKVRV